MRTAGSWGIFVLVMLIFAFTAGPTALGGPASYVIVDGRSMEPTYQDGDLVVAYQSDAYDLDDVIVYDAPVDTQFNVIHRIIERTDGGFITQGDNRDERDGWIAPDDEIYGKALFHIPRAGTLLTFLRQPAAILAFLAGWLTLAIFDRRRPADEGEGDTLPGTDHEDGDVDGVPHNRDSFVSSQLTPVSSLAAKQKQGTKKPVSKKTIAIFAIAGLIGASAGIIVANAASLRVDAGILQAFSITDLPELPDEPQQPGTVNLLLHFFSSGQGPDAGKELGQGGSPVSFDPIEIPPGHRYDIEWDGPGKSNVVECFDNDDITFRDGDPSPSPQGTIGPFGPLVEDELITHLLCIQAAPGNVLDNLTFTTIDEDEVHTVVELNIGSVIESTCDVADEDACAESDGESEPENLGDEPSFDGGMSKPPNVTADDQIGDSGESADKPAGSRSDGSEDADDAGGVDQGLDANDGDQDAASGGSDGSGDEPSPDDSDDESEREQDNGIDPEAGQRVKPDETGNES